MEVRCVAESKIYGPPQVQRLRKARSHACLRLQRSVPIYRDLLCIQWLFVWHVLGVVGPLMYSTPGEIAVFLGSDAYCLGLYKVTTTAPGHLV